MNTLKKYLSLAIIFSIATTSYSPPFSIDSLGSKFEFLHKLPGKKDIIDALSKKRVAALVAPLALLGLAVKYDPYYKAAELFTLFDYIENQMNEEQMQRFLTSLNISLDSYWAYLVSETEEYQFKLNISHQTGSTRSFSESQLKVLNQPLLINNEFVDTTHSLHPYTFTQVNGDTISQNGSGFPLHQLLESTHSPVYKHPECAKIWDFNNPNNFEEFKRVWFTALNQTFGHYYNNGKISMSVSLANNNMKWLNEQRDKLIVTLFDTILKKSKDESFELILDILGLVPDSQNKFTGNNHWGLALMMIRDAIKTAPKNSHLKTMINYLKLRLNPFNFGRIHSDLPAIMK